MSVMRLYQDNRIFSLAAIKNGSGGAPAIDEDLGFPMSNIKLRSRYRFWRTSAAPANPVDVDFDLIAIGANPKSVGLANIRSYRGTAGITSLEVFYATGTTYPPGAWVQRLAPQAVTTADNDLMWDTATTPTARFWRFRIANSGQFSCKPWIVLSASVIDLQEGFDLTESVYRIRAPEAKTLLGSVVFTDLGVGKAQVITEWSFKGTTGAAQKIAALRIQDGKNYMNPMFRDIYGRHIQVSASDPTARWRRSGIVISTRQEMEFNLVQLP